MVDAARGPLILVIEDRPEMMALVHRTLSGDGFAVVQASNAQRGLTAAFERDPQLIILDVGLPDRSGLDVARDLRAGSFHGALLMLTARDSVADKVEGLNAGADDYLSKPFDPDELTARVQALLRRSRRSGAETTLALGQLRLHLVARQASWAGTAIPLTQREYELLEFLMRQAEQRVTHEEISREVWGREDNAHNVVGVYISYLRRKLANAGAPAIIETMSGGYALRSQPTPPSRKSRAREP